jgi:peptidyl-prolyl cis-trans isomerase SurA
MSDSLQRKLARHAVALAVTALAGLTATSVLAQQSGQAGKPAATASKKGGKASAKPRAAKPARKADAATTKAKAAAAGAAAVAAPVAASAASAPPDSAPKTGSDARTRQADYIVALVNGEPITNNELRARVNRARQQLRERNLAEPPEDELRKQVLEVFISERAQLQLAKEMGLEVDQLTLDQAEATVAQQNELPTAQALHQALQREGISVKDFRDDLRRQIQLQRLRERAIEPRVKVSDTEVDRFLRSQAAQQGVQAVPEVNLAMILVRVPEGSSPADVAKLRERADDVVRRAKAGEDFAKLAAEYSQSTGEGKDGGELGLRPVDKYPSLFVNATSRLAAGGVTDVVRSDAGFHVLKVLERKRGAMPTMTVPQTHVRHILLTLTSGQDEQLALQRLRDFKRRVDAGQADFAELARENSQDASAKDGGDLGWANPGQFVPEFEQVMNGLAPGQVSEPLRSRFGLHLIQVMERREQPLSESDQRAVARNMLRERKMAEEYETWAKEVRGRAYVELRDPPY